MARPKSEKQAARLTVTLDADDYAKVCTLAHQSDVSAAWIIRRAVQAYLHGSRPKGSQASIPVVSQGGGHA